MHFSRERARAAANAKYIQETDTMCDLLHKKDIEGIKAYLVKFEKQKKRYATHFGHWTKSGAVAALVEDMQALCSAHA